MNPSKVLQSSTNEKIRDCLEHAHVPALMCSLVHLTGDIELLRGDIRPYVVPMGNPNQSISEEAKSKIVNLALEVVSNFRDGQIAVESDVSTHVPEMTNFITGEKLSEEYSQFAVAELAIDGSSAYNVSGLTSIPLDQREKFKVAIIGAGMSGILAAIRLKQAGIPFVVLEKNSDVGGTWFENRYPGCRVDSPNHVYSYSFAPKDWPQHFSDQTVLLDYFQSVAKEHDLRTSIRFQTEVTEMRYCNDTALWTLNISTEAREEQLTVNAVIVAVGQLNRPKLPEIEGRDKFRGPSFHSAEWDTSVEFAEKTVAVIGTGASAFQFTPHIVKQAKSVDVFLRTPPWVAINPLYQAHITDQQHWLLNNVPFYATWFRFSMFWTSGEGLLSMARCDPNWDRTRNSISEANDRLREMLTRGIETQLDDRPDLISKLTPTYPPAAKRMLIDDGEWYRALKSRNVRVVDTKIESINETGIQLVDGSRFDYDIILYGTGFHANQILYPMKIYGSDGQELRSSWGDDPRAYLGITIPNYPNMYTMYGPNTNIVVNGSIIFFSECEMLYIMQSIRHLLVNEYASMDCDPAFHDSYNERIDRENLGMSWGASDVNSWYKNANGRVTQCWPGTLIEFWRQCRDFDPHAYLWNNPSETGNAKDLG
ncbi:MAG: NAD(P)/FAD-dependent oxidoreductase [Gammaproteobacteria bacterium]|nr:NAD(P)/FAD-dependent oxidoreductase [Gammaproteobacteria bacterium]